MFAAFLRRNASTEAATVGFDGFKIKRKIFHSHFEFDWVSLNQKNRTILYSTYLKRLDDQLQHLEEF